MQLRRISPQRARYILAVAILTTLALYSRSDVVWKPGTKGTLPNGWRISPAGQLIPTGDGVVDFAFSRDGATIIAVHAGYNAHGLAVVDRRTARISQTIELDSAWIGMA